MIYLTIINELGDELGSVRDNTVPIIGENISIIDNLRDVTHDNLKITGVKRVYSKTPEAGSAVELSRIIVTVEMPYTGDNELDGVMEML